MGQDERGGKGKSSSFALGRKKDGGESTEVGGESKEVGACRQVSTHDGREA